jgi:ABC-type cobalamin/Fe3+-siderophores transport system ATPase subunit
VTVVTVTHNINSAVLASRTVLALKEGSVAFYGPAGSFIDIEILQEIYEKPFVLVRHPQQDRNMVAPEAPQ